MKRFILLLTSIVLCALSHGATLVDTLIDFEDSTSGTTMTTTILGNGTIGDIGTWSINAPVSAARITVGLEDDALFSNVTVGGTAYDGAGTRSLSVQMGENSHYVNLSLDTAVDSLSVGFWWTPGDDSSFVVTDDCYIGSSLTGGFVVLQRTTEDDLLIHTTGTNNGSTISTFIEGNSYWVTILAEKGDSATTLGTCKLRIYESDGTLFGESIVATHDNDDGQFDFIRFGRTDSHGPATNYTTEFDNIIIDVTDATWPLLPIESTATATSATAGSVNIGN